jgi:hypothetical protein
MFAKIVIILSLLIILASLLSEGRAPAPARKPRSRLRRLMNKTALILLALAGAALLIHVGGFASG